MNKDNKVSTTVIRRLPTYHRYLEDLVAADVNRISSKELSKLTGFTASQIRQDLNNFGGFGQQGYGYNVKELLEEIEKILGLNKVYNVVVTGAGNLGNAIANYRGFLDAGFKIIGVFDKNPNNPRYSDRNLDVHPIEKLEEFLRSNSIDIGIITTSKREAQEVADTYVRNGVKGIWNFATTDLEVPEEVALENVRLSESLYTLSYFIKDKI